MAPVQALRVLVVDDGPDQRETLSELIKFWGHEAHTAENGKIAVEMVESSDYDIVILDMHMPVMDGLTAAELIRKQSRRLTLIAYSVFALVERKRVEAAGWFDLLLDKGSFDSISTLEARLAELSHT